MIQTRYAKLIKGDQLSKLNALRFTVHTEDLDFKNKLLAFINKQELLNISSEANDYTYKLNLVDDFLTMYGQASAAKSVDIVKNEGISFFHLHIDGSSYSFSFDNIIKLYEFYKDSEIIGDIVAAYLASDYIFSEYALIQKRAAIIKNVLKFLLEEGLLATSTINALSFVSTLNSTDDADLLKQLIKEGKASKDELQKNMYTGAFNHYKAYIKQPQKIINIYRMGRGEANIDIHILGDEEVLKMLKEAVKGSFTKAKTLLHIKKDAGGYYIYADESCLKVWNKPIKIVEGIFVEFKPVLTDLQNFYGINKSMKQECLLKLQDSKIAVDKKVYDSLETTDQAGIDDEDITNEIFYKKVHKVDIRSKEKNAFILEINDWEITDENVLQSHKGSAYTLGDDIEDLLKHIDKIPKFPNIPPKISNEVIRDSLGSLLS